MSNNETPNSNAEQRMNRLFSSLREARIEPSPYLKTRVLAYVNSHPKTSGNLFFWKALSLGSLLSLAVVVGISVYLYNKSPTDGFVKQAYVIHIDFNETDKTQVVHAEIELPRDVHFVSSNKKVREEKKLSLPVAVKSLGKGKLPFVVASDKSGEKEIKVRLFNRNDELVREQVLKLKFAKDGASTIF